MSGGADIRLAVVASRVRVEEKQIFAALERRAILYERLDERRLSAEISGARTWPYAAVLNRSISNTRSLYVAHLFEAQGSVSFNSSQVITTCGDKLLTSLALVAAGIPTPRTSVALTPEAALPAIERIGYPVVLKPVHGSWGRLLAKIGDRQAAEAVLEHKQALGSPIHSVIYIQEYVDKPGRDLRTIVVGDQVICAMYRHSEHWITNTARGGVTTPCDLTPDLVDLSLRAAQAVGGGALAIDMIEGADGALLVTEINHTMEFHGMVDATGVDVADALVAYVQQAAGL